MAADQMVRRMACTECRQQKVRCVGNPDGPCQRCEKRRIPCVVDAEYKRTAKRKQVELLESELRKLRRQVKDETSVSPSPVEDSRVFAVPDGLPRVTWTEARRQGIPLYDMTLPEGIDFQCLPKTHKDIVLDPETIAALYQEYVVYYHPFLPIVDILLGPEGIYNLSAPLFWSIMTVASRRYKDGELLTKLSATQKAQLAELAVSPVVMSGEHRVSFNLPTVYAVQCFLLSTLWPFPTSSINADSSWNTSGIAYFMAMRAGLHFPGYERDFGRIYKSQDGPVVSAKKSEQVTTWMATTSIAQIVACMFGFPSSAIFPKAQLYTGMDIPDSIKHLFMIQEVAHEIEESLNSNTRELVALTPLSERLSLIRILSARLDDIELQHGSKLNDSSWFSLLAVRVGLSSYYFFGTENMSEIELQKGFLAAYNSSLFLMDHVAECQNRNDNFMGCMPQVNVQLLWQASAIVAKLYHSKWSRVLDRKKGKELYFATAENIAKASVLDHDVPFRAGEIMTQMWQVFSVMFSNQKEDIVEARISVRTRYAASVFFDCLWKMRSECEIMSHAPTELSHHRHRKRPLSGPHVGRARKSAIRDTIKLESPVQSPAVGESTYHDSPTIHTPESLPAGQSGSRSALPQDTEYKTSPIDASTDSNAGSSWEWDSRAVYRDVDNMIGDFGFQMDEFMHFS